MAPHQAIDLSLARLHKAGWTIREIGMPSIWYMVGTHGQYHIGVTTDSREEGLDRLCHTAEDLGLLTPDL